MTFLPYRVLPSQKIDFPVGFPSFLTEAEAIAYAENEVTDFKGTQYVCQVLDRVRPDIPPALPPIVEDPTV
jgi:hypothetical protein